MSQIGTFSKSCARCRPLGAPAAHPHCIACPRLHLCFHYTGPFLVPLFSLSIVSGVWIGREGEKLPLQLPYPL
jgi:hypothetical protein